MSPLLRVYRRAAALVVAVAALSAAPAIGQNVSFVGAGPQVTSAAAGSITPEIPSGTVANDLAVLVVAGRPSDTSNPAAPSGWTLRTSALREVGATDLKIVTFYRVLTGGDSDPVITLPAGWVGSGAGMSGQIAVWRDVSTTSPFDVADATDDAASAATWVPPAITTATASARVVTVAATSDDNDIDLSAAASFTERMSGTGYDTTTGGDHAVGLADKTQSTPGAVAMPTWSQNANSSDRWVGITFALRPAPASAATISYDFDETSWTGAAGQVTDTGTYGLDGTAFGGATTASTTPAKATNPGTCGYGVFDGAGDYVQVPDNAALDISSELTVSAWIYMHTTPSELHTIVSKDTNYEFHIDSNRHVYWWWNDSNGNVRNITTNAQIALNQWYHIAVAYQSGTQRIYIDGVAQAPTASYTGTLAQNNEPLFIGTDTGFLVDRSFDGYIDDVRIMPRYYSQAEVQALRDETHPCSTTAAFTINHNSFGINCVAETVTLNVVDATAGTPLTNYNAEVRLDTQSGYGAWSLVTGSGALVDGTANDGIATYTWPLNQSSATFSLYYPEGPASIDIDVYQVADTGVRDTDAEGALVFSPNGFTVTAAQLSNPPPSSITTFATNQTAGTAFDLHLAAYGQTATDATCGIIEGYTGTKSLRFWSTYANPTTGTRNVTIGGTSIATSETAADSATTQNVTFTNGRAVVTAKYKDVGQIRVNMKDNTTVNAELPSGITGATNLFVVKPYDFVFSGIANAANTVTNPQASTATGSVFIAAGEPFRATVTVRDSEGSATPNYGRETPAATVRLVPELTLPSGGAIPGIGAATGFGSFTNGVATGTDFTWSEVGIIRWRGGVSTAVGVADYLGAGDVLGVTQSDNVGRFIPHHFNVTTNAPSFTTACTAGGFTYQGQPFGYATAPVITATAVALGGTTTTNYTTAKGLFKLSNSTLTGRAYTAANTLTTSGLPATTTDPAIVDLGDGRATLTFSSGSGLAFARSLLAPFQAGVQLSINVLDSDGVAAVGTAPYGNPVTFGSAGGITFSAGQEIRYGRVRIGTAIGSERVNLPVPMRAEHYASSTAGFVTNVNDTCSTGVSLVFSGYTENLAAGETCVLDSGSPGSSGSGCAAAAAVGERFREPPTVAAGGEFNLRLAAPGAGNQGSVVITATVPTWLQYDWNTATSGDENPTGQATFGIFGGEGRQIYTREIY